MKIIVKTEVEITESLITTIMEGAFYGMTYWAESMTVKNNGDFIEEKDRKYYSSERYAKILLNNGSLKVTLLPGLESSKSPKSSYILNISKLAKGIKIVLEKYNHLLNISNIEDVDSMAGECIIQCALFGDIIYG